MRPILQILSADLVQAILDDARRILSEVGVMVGGPSLRARLLDHGLAASDAGRLLFPPELVERAVAAAPSSFTLYDREGEPRAGLGAGAARFVPGSSGLRVLDGPGARPAATADFMDYVRVADGLDELDFLATAFSTDDVPPEIADAWRLFLCLTGSRRPVVSGAFTARGVPRMAEMMAAFRRDGADLAARPLAVFTITPSGSFGYGADSCANLMDCVASGIPVEIVPVTTLGLTAPVMTVAAAAFHVADVLAGITMAQLLAPGHPVLFGGAPAAFHMGTTTSPMSAIEALRVTAAYSAVGRALELPTQAYLGLSDSRALDAQAGAETFAGVLLATLGGVDLAAGAGMLDHVLTFSLEKLVLDAELIGQARVLAREAPAAGPAAVELARELLAEGHLLASDHTLEHWRDHLHLPGPVIDRGHVDPGTGEGGLRARAAAEVDRLRAAHEPPETDARAVDELRRLLLDGAPPGTELPPASY